MLKKLIIGFTPTGSNISKNITLQQR